MQPFRAVVALFLFLSLAVAQTAPTVADALPIGSATVSEAKGEVTVTSPQGSPLTIQRGLTLAPDSTIETAKGSLLLQLQDGSQVLIKAHSKVVLRSPDRDKGYWLELLLGKILATVQKRMGSTPSFRLGTPTAVITVRGTRFLVDVNKSYKTTVEVYEGLVEVASLAPGTAPVLLHPGFSTDVNRDHAPSEPSEFGVLGNSGERDGSGGGQRDSVERGDQSERNAQGAKSAHDQKGPD
jgi:hypothetical protein